MSITPSLLNDSDSIAVTSRAFSESRNLRAALEMYFKNIRYNETGRSLKADEKLDFLSDCRGAIVSLDKIDVQTLNLLPKLKVISKYGVGLDNLDLDALASREILLGWKGGVNRRAVAELTLTMMLLGVRRSFEANLLLQVGQWQPLPGRQLTDKTVGIIGCGHIGKEVVSLLKPFECKILVHDIHDYPDFYRKFEVTPSSLENLLKTSDVVSIHVPLTNRTKHLINKKNVGLLKPGAVLINTARGGVIEEAALIDRLESKSLYCGFDVFEEEPAQTPILHYATFFGTPHIGGSSIEAQFAMGEAAIRGLLEPVSVLELKNRKLLPVLD